MLFGLISEKEMVQSIDKAIKSALEIREQKLQSVKGWFDSEFKRVNADIKTLTGQGKRFETYGKFLQELKGSLNADLDEIHKTNEELNARLIQVEEWINGHGAWHAKAAKPKRKRTTKKAPKKKPRKRNTVKATGR